MSGQRGWQQLRAEWRSNPRLRYGGMVIVLILGVQGLLMLSDRIDKYVAAYKGDMEMLARLESVRKETWWPERAKQTQATLDNVTGRIPEVAGKGMAQAESQAWLTHFVADQKLEEPRVKVEDTVDVDGYPDLWQVIARVEGKLPENAHEPFVRALADALPWNQVERLDIPEGSAPRMVATFRSYYRKATPASDAGKQGAAAGRDAVEQTR